MSLDKTLLDIAKSAVDTQRKSRDGRNVVSRGVDAATNKSYANEDKKVAAAALRQWENSTWKPKVEAKLKQELKTRAPHLKPGSEAYQQTYDSLFNKNYKDLQSAKAKAQQQIGTLRQEGQTQRQVDNRYTQKESLRNNTAKIQSAARIGRDVAEEAAGALATGGSRTFRYPLQFAADIGENDDGGIFDRGAKALERHEDNLQQVYPAYADTQQNGSFTERLTLSAIEQIPSIALSFAGAGAAAKGVQLAGAGAKTTAAVSYGTAAATMYPQAYGDGNDSTKQELENATPEQLATAVRSKDIYKGHFDKNIKAGMSEDEAYQKARDQTISSIAEESGDAVGLATLALSMLAPGIGSVTANHYAGGAVSKWGQKVFNTLAAKADAGKVAKIAIPAAVGTSIVGLNFAEEALQEGFTDYTAQKAAVDVGVKQKIDAEQNKEAMLMGGILGAAMGGGAYVGTRNSKLHQAQDDLKAAQQAYAEVAGQIPQLQEQIEVVSPRSPEGQALTARVEETSAALDAMAAEAEKAGIPRTSLARRAPRIDPTNSAASDFDGQVEGATELSEQDFENALNPDGTPATQAPVVQPMSEAELDAQDAQLAELIAEQAALDEAIEDGSNEKPLEESIAAAQSWYDNKRGEGKQGLAGVVSRAAATDQDAAFAQQQEAIKGTTASINDYIASERAKQQQIEAQLQQEAQAATTDAEKQAVAQKIEQREADRAKEDELLSSREQLAQPYENESFDTTVIGADGAPFNLARFWDSNMPATAKAKAIAEAFGGEVEQNVAKADWQSMPEGVQKELHQWFTDSLDGVRQSREGATEQTSEQVSTPAVEQPQEVAPTGNGLTMPVRAEQAPVKDKTALEYYLNRNGVLTADQEAAGYTLDDLKADVASNYQSNPQGMVEATKRAEDAGIPKTEINQVVQETLSEQVGWTKPAQQLAAEQDMTPPGVQAKIDSMPAPDNEGVIYRDGWRTNIEEARVAAYGHMQNGRLSDDDVRPYWDNDIDGLVKLIDSVRNKDAQSPTQLTDENPVINIPAQGSKVSDKSATVYKTKPEANAAFRKQGLDVHKTDIIETKDGYIIKDKPPRETYKPSNERKPVIDTSNIADTIHDGMTLDELSKAKIEAYKLNEDRKQQNTQDRERHKLILQVNEELLAAIKAGDKALASRLMSEIDSIEKDLTHNVTEDRFVEIDTNSVTGMEVFDEKLVKLKAKIAEDMPMQSPEGDSAAGIYKSKPAAKAAIKKQKLDPNSVTINQVKGGGFEIVPNTPAKPSYAQAEEQAATELGMTLNEDGEYGGTDAEFEAFAKRVDEIQGRSLSNSTPTPQQNTVAPNNDVAIGKDGQAKWFGSNDKAQAFIDKKGISDTHEVVSAGKSRFEIQPKAQTTGATNQTSTPTDVISESGGPNTQELTATGKAKITGQEGWNGNLPKTRQLVRQLYEAGHLTKSETDKAFSGGIHSLTDAAKTGLSRQDQEQPTTKAKPKNITDEQFAELTSSRTTPSTPTGEQSAPAKRAEAKKAAKENKVFGVAQAYHEPKQERLTVEPGDVKWRDSYSDTNAVIRQLVKKGYLEKSEFDNSNKEHSSLIELAIKGIKAEREAANNIPQTATEKTQNEVSEQESKSRFADNKLFTEDKVAAARALLKSKMGQVNSGFDPEMAIAGMTLAGAYIESGVRKFGDYAKLMVEDFGDNIKPQLLSFWEGARNWDGLDTEGMTSVADSKREYDQLKAESEQASTPTEPKPAQTIGSGSQKKTLIGENEEGLPLWESESGIRATEEYGMFVNEAIAITPTGGEREIRKDRYLTTEELAQKDNDNDTGTSNQDDRQRADGELSTADQADAESRNAGRAQAESTSNVSDLDGRGARSDTIESDGDSRSAAARQRTDADDSDSRADSTQSNDGAAKETDATPTVKAKNYVISPADSNEKLSWQKVAERNVSIIELVKQLDTEGRQATANEQALLAQYAGWGASEIANGIFPNPDTGKYKSDSWQALGEKLQSLLTDSEYDTARRTTQYAHYTPPVLVEGIYKALENFGFKGGQVLEPASGIGVFNGLMPKKMADSSAYVGLELDPITGRIAQHLYPQSTMKIDDYIKAKLPDDHFDVAVGNPPFAGISVSYKGAGKNSTKQSMQLHDYFFAKTLDKLKPGGVMAFVTSKGTMDKKGSSVRELLAEQADLIGAIRLPQTAFKENAGTEVVTDIIFLRKRLEGEQPSDTAWANVKTIQASGKPTAINEYFVNNPDMVLGEHAITSGRFGDTYTVTPNKGDFASQVNQAIDKLPKDVFNPQRGSTAEAIKVAGLDYDAASSANKEGGVYLKDGKLMRVVDGVGKPLTQRYGTNGKAINLSAKDIAFMTDYVGVRDALKQAQRDQLNDSDTWEDSLAALNSTYDAFVKKHGPLMAHTVSERENNDGSVTVTKRFKNKQRLFLDVEGVLASALENVIDDGKGTVVKGSFFEGRSLRKPKAPTITSTQDALVYTLDEKGVLDIDRIAQVTNQSREQVITELGDQIYSDPTTNQWDLAETYLSGNVVEKLATAKAAAKNNSTYNRNVKALEAVQPAPIAPNDISSNMGAAWIPGSAIKEFSEEVLGAKIDAEYSSAVGLWDVSGNSRSSDYATADRTTVQLVESILNSRKISITRKSADGGTFTDSVATELANEVARKIKTEFKKWLWSDDTRTQELADYYNKTYNNIVPPTFNGDHLTLAGMSNKIQLRAPQKRGIYRVIRQGDVYLNHAVGAGKTFTMIAAAMEEKRLGLINKPMFVVPNHMLDQFSQEFLMLYPAANIMVADEQNFHTHNRKQFVAQAALNTPDAIIITHSGFERIGVKPDTKKAFLENKIEEWQAALESTKASDGDNRTSVKQLERNIESLERNLDDILSAKEKDGAVFFEDMGVDKLYIDEAHEFRKLNFVTKMGNIKGIDPAGSQKAMDLDLKLQLLRKSNPTRAFVGASGTPVTNTMGELYTIQHYFQPEQLQQDGLHHFDSWANQFGEVVEGLEQNAAGNYEVVPRFARFVNVPELMSRVRSFMDVLTSQDLGDFVVRPNVHTGGREVVAIPTPDGFSEYQKTLSERIDAIRSRSGKPEKGDDIILSVIGDGRFSAIDMRFVDPELPSDPNSKLNQAIQNMADAYHATADNQYMTDGKPDQYKGGALMMFTDIGLGEQSAASRGFNMKEWISSELIRKGVKPEHIAFMRDNKTHAKKGKLFDDMRQGRKRIMIGGKDMETGVNAQKRLTHLFHLDAPWFPASVEQREGRIIRQGNQNKEVTVKAFATKGSYDSTMWSMVARKARFIEQAMRGDATVRSMDDVSEASAFEQASALSSGDPRSMQLAGLRQDVERLNRQLSGHQNEKFGNQNKARDARRTLARAERELDDINKLLPTHKNIETGDVIGKVGGKAFDNRAEFGQAIIAAYNKRADNFDTGEHVLGTAAGYDVVYNGVMMDGGNFYADANINIPKADDAALFDIDNAKDTRPDGLTTRIINRVNKLADYKSKIEQLIEQSKTNAENFERRANQSFDAQTELEEKSRELKELEDTLASEAEALKQDSNPNNFTDADRVPAPDAPKFSRIAASDSQIDAIRKEFESTDKWMKAPNGKPTNLNEQQWLQVRTPAFKQWFGDWENDPANASKVIDGNSEPMVVYHGTNASFTEFDASKLGESSGDNGAFGEGFYFSPDRVVAEGYKGTDGTAGEYFLNIRRVLQNNSSDMKQFAGDFGVEMETISVDKDTLRDLFLSKDPGLKALFDFYDSNNRNDRASLRTVIDSYKENGGALNPSELSNFIRLNNNRLLRNNHVNSLEDTYNVTIPNGAKNNKWVDSLSISSITENGVRNKGFTDTIRSAGYDGVSSFDIDGSRSDIDNEFEDWEVVVFNPNQIKSATDNAGTFDDSNPDIRYSKTNPAKGNTGTTSQQVITVLQNRFGKEVVASLVKSGKLRVRTLNDFVNADGRLLIPSDAEGFYYDGKVTLIADNLTPETAVATLLHEFGGHAGIQSMLAPQTYMSLMENFDALVRSGNKYAVRAKERAEAMTGSDSEARDEYIPYLITEYAQATERGGPLAVIKRFVNRVMAGVRTWVRKHTGVQLKMTPNDMVQLAERMVKRLAEQSADSMTIAGVENVPSGQSQFSQDSVDQTDTPAFKKWFGDSKVVDSNGDPLVVYHGTIKAFNEFNTTDFGALLGKGSYFTASESEASSYSGGGTRVVPAYLSIENPYYVDSGLASVPSRQQMLKDGHDGVIYRDTDGSVKWAVAHKPAQIKSATDNTGTFDNSNPDIRYSKTNPAKGNTDTPAFKEWFGDSKVVDANGEPLVVYHGTQSSEFNTFENQKQFNLFGDKNQFYFTENQREALGYATGNADTTAKGRSGKGRVIAGFLKIENPADMRSATWNVSDVDVQSYFEDMDMEGLYDALVSAGYDGIIYDSEIAPIPVLGDHYVVFEPTQIKSATDNAGTFDPSNPDIRFSRRYSTLGTDGKPVTAKEKARDRVALAQATTMSSKFGVSLLLRRHLATPQHVALLNPVFKIFTDNVQARIAYENNEAGLVQTLLPEIWDTRLVVGKKKEAMERVSKAIFDGTMADKVWSDSELQTMFNLTDKDIGFYRRARAAIDTSVMNMTVDTLSSLAKGTKLVNIETIHKLKLQGMHPIFHNLALQQHMTDELEKLAKGGLITPKAEARMQKQLDDVFDVMAAIAMKYDKLVADGYAPLMRFGHYAVEVRDKTTNDLDLFELYETKGQQRKAIKELKERYDETQFTVGTGTLNPEGFKQFKNKGLSPETVQLFAAELGLDDDGAYQAYLKIAVSDRSALKRLIHRKKVPGYSEDMPRVLSSFVMSNARYSGRGLYNSEIERSIQNINDGNLQNEAQKVFENIENPQEEFAQQRSLMFHYFMGFSPAFFFLNLTQPFTQTIPKLTAYVGAGKGHAYMAQALGIVGKHIGRSTVELGKKIAGMPAPNWGGFEDNLPAWVKKEDYLRMAREGHLDPQNIYMIKGLERGKGGVASGVWGNIEAAAGWFAEVSESINRRSTMIAAFRVAKDMGDAKLKAKGFDSKYEFAVSMIQQTQGIYNKGNRSGLARGNGKLGQYGPLILVFKQFTINYTEQMIRHGRDKEVKALAVAMMWQYILAGMLGLPFADDLRDIFEGIAYRVFGKAFNLPDYLQEKLGKSNADALMYGIASEKGLIDIHGRSSLGNIIPGTDVVRPGPTDWAEILGASSGFYESFFSAASMAAEGNHKDALITASPRFIRDAASGAEIALTGSYRNTKGDKIMDLDKTDAVIKAMQFNPANNARPGRDRSNAYDMKNMLKAKTDYFSKHLAEAIYQENDARVDELYNEMDEWNERNAEHFNVDIDKIENSAEKRVERKDFGSDERQNIQDSLALRQEELAGT